MTVRILRIVARMNVGGPAVEITTLMRGLDSQAFHQELLVGSCGPDEEDFLTTQAPDIPYRRIPGLGRSVRPLDDLRALRATMRHIRAFNPDIIHTHTAKAGAIGRIAAILVRSKARRVHTFHGHILHGYFTRWQSTLIRWWEATLARRTNVLITVGNAVRDQLIQQGIGTIKQFHVIPPGIALTGIPSREQARDELALDAAVPVLCYVGRITGIKRPDRMLDVVQCLTAAFPNLKVLVAGGGDLEASIRADASARALPIHFLGWRTDIATIFAASNVTLLTSDNEGTPISLIQAGLCGIPSVATSVGSVDYVVPNGVAGLVVPPITEELCEAVGTLLRDEPLRRALGEGARAHACKEFSVVTFLNRHADIYRNAP